MDRHPWTPMDKAVGPHATTPFAPCIRIGFLYVPIWPCIVDHDMNKNPVFTFPCPETNPPDGRIPKSPCLRRGRQAVQPRLLGHKRATLHWADDSAGQTSYRASCCSWTSTSPNSNHGSGILHLKRLTQTRPRPARLFFHAHNHVRHRMEGVHLPASVFTWLIHTCLPAAYFTFRTVQILP